MADEENIHDRVERARNEMAAELDAIFGTAETPIDGLARAQHECAEVFGKHGFTRSEALYMTTAMFNGNPGVPPG